MRQRFLRLRLTSLIRLRLSPLRLVRLMPFRRPCMRQCLFERLLRPSPYPHPTLLLAPSPPSPPPRAATPTRTPSQPSPARPFRLAHQQESSNRRSSRFLVLERRASPAVEEREGLSERVLRAYRGARVWVRVVQADRLSSDLAATSPPPQQPADSPRRLRTATARSRASNRSPRLAARVLRRNSRRASRLARRSSRKAPQLPLLDQSPPLRRPLTPVLEPTATLPSLPASTAAKARTPHLDPTAAAAHQADQANGAVQSRLAPAHPVSFDRELRVGCRLAQREVRASRV